MEFQEKYRSSNSKQDHMWLAWPAMLCPKSTQRLNTNALELGSLYHHLNTAFRKHPPCGVLKKKHTRCFLPSTCQIMGAIAKHLIVILKRCFSGPRCILYWRSKVDRGVQVAINLNGCRLRFDSQQHCWKNGYSKEIYPNIIEFIKFNTANTIESL